MRDRPDNDETDASLIERVGRGDERAWRALVDRHGALVHSIPARHGLSREDCEDVFQSVWTIAVRHAPGMRDGQAFAAWLITTTQRETWRVLRKRPRASESRAREREAELGSFAEQELIEERAGLRAALARMDPRCRDLLLAAFAEDRPSYDLLADRLGIPRGSIGPTRARCLSKLAKLVGVDWTETE